MGFFDNFTKSVNKLSKKVSTGAKNISTITKLNGEISQARRDINLNLMAIGKAALEKKDTKYKEFIEEIDTANALIEKNGTLVKALRGTVNCQNCGAESSIDAEFCGKCGTKLEKPDIPQNEADASPAGGLICPECGEANADDAEFCAGCGANLSGKAE